QTLRVSSPFSTAHVQNIGRSLWTTPPAPCPATLSDTRRIFHQPLFPAPDTARPRSAGPCQCSNAGGSDVEAEVQHVAFLDDVVLAFQAQAAGFLGALLALEVDEVVIA